MKKLCFIFISSVLLAACGTSSSTKPLYYWENYSNTVYEGMQNKLSASEQITKLEEYLEKARAKDLAVAPGVYAQLGMLYLQTGQQSQAHQAFLKEKEAFPESAAFIDFLLKKQMKGQK